MPAGRPTEYKEEYVAKADEYIRLNQDENLQLTTQSGKLGESWDNKLKVSLPTIEGFAVFIAVNKATLYDWAKIHPLFNNALERIKQEQHKRLLNSGLSGDYNSTIAKLVLSSNHGYKEKNETEHKGDLILNISEAIANKNKDE